MAAYPEKAIAQRHAELAKGWYLANGGVDLSETRYPPSQLKNPYDSQMRVDYTGTDWIVESVEFREEVPKVVP